MQVVSPSSEYSLAPHGVWVVREEHSNPAGHLIQAEDPAVLISSELQATQAEEALDPELGLAVPAAHAVLPLAPPRQL